MSTITYDGQTWERITPHTHPERFTDEEQAIFDEGKCCWLTAYGLPHALHCRRPSDPNMPFGYCREHGEEFLEAYLPNGNPRHRYQGE